MAHALLLTASSFGGRLVAEIGRLCSTLLLAPDNGAAVIRFASTTPESTQPPTHPDWLLNKYPAWLLDMAMMVKASEESSEPDFGAFRHLLECDYISCCNNCCNANHAIRCSGCQSNYYCPDHCRRSYLYSYCNSSACGLAVEQRAQWTKDLSVISFGDGSTGDAVTTPATSQDATCGICLKEKIIRPLVLPNCRHVFCFACIEKYQETNQAPMWRNNKTCPLCRAVTDKALHKARMELKRVEMLLDDDDIVGRRDLCNKAMLEIGALGADGGNVAALLVRADLLKHVDPLKAIKLYETLVKAARSRMRLEQQAKLHVGKAQSYKAAGLFAEALAEYRRVNEGRKKPMSAETRSEFDLGMSRCYFHLGMFKEAISKAEHYVVQERRVAGGHKIVAMALLAMAEEAKTSGAVETVFIGKNVSMTLAGAVEVAYKGLVL